MEKFTALDVQHAWAHNEPDEAPTTRETDEQIVRDLARADEGHWLLCARHRVAILRRAQDEAFPKATA